MNRIGSRAAGPPSKATASTLCQKCLKRGHYSYECTSKAQERPYATRPSRTQQLLNPKLLPKLASDEPNALLRKDGIADEQLAKIDKERGRKRRRLDGAESDRSHSSSSSASVSTISTNLSRSPSPTKQQRGLKKSSAKVADSERESRSEIKRRHRRHRRSSIVSSHESSRERPAKAHQHQSSHTRLSNSSRSSDGSPRSPSPPARGGHRHRSRSPGLDESYASNRRRRSSPQARRRDDGRGPVDHHPRSEEESHQPSARGKPQRGRNERQPRRDRSLSPYSKRLALTQAMNMGR